MPALSRGRLQNTIDTNFSKISNFYVCSYLIGQGQDIILPFLVFTLDLEVFKDIVITKGLVWGRDSVSSV